MCVLDTGPFCGKNVACPHCEGIFTFLQQGVCFGNDFFCLFSEKMKIV